MTDNEIIQALPFLAQYCKDEYNDIKADEVLLGALNIINHQQTENEALQMELEVTRDNLGDTRAELNNAETEIERFKKIETTVDDFWSGLQKLAMFKDKEIPTLEELLEYMDNLKIEAIKEFARRLKAKAKDEFMYDYKMLTMATEFVVVKEIDNLVKEMVGDAE